MKHTDHEDPDTTTQKAVAALARNVEQLSRDLQALKGGMRTTASKTSVTELANVVTDLGDTVMKIAAGARKGTDEEVVVRSWLRLPEDDPVVVEGVLSELVPWMQSVYLRYSDAAETLPPCWLWHPEVVEELVWLMDAWTAAFYGAEASVRLVGDWHDRQRPGVMRRVGLYTSNCDLTIHHEHADQKAVTVPLVEHLDQFVTWWSTGRDANGPAPTEKQIRAGRRGGLTAVPATDGGY